MPLRMRPLVPRSKSRVSPLSNINELRWECKCNRMTWEFLGKSQPHKAAVHARGEFNSRPFGLGPGFFQTATPHLPPSRLPRTSTMASTSQQPEGRDGVISTLDVFIQTLTLAKDTCGVLPAQVTFGSAVVLLTMIRVRLLLLRGDKAFNSRRLGLDGQRSRLRRSWAGLR